MIIQALLGFVTLMAVASSEDPKTEMRFLAAEITGLQKYLLSEAEFSKPENHQKILGSLGRMNEHLSHLKEKSFTNESGLSLNLEMLLQHLKESNRVFERGNKGFARYMVQSAMGFCIECHTRRKGYEFDWSESPVEKAKPIERADFLFATRQFQKGVNVYDSIVRGGSTNLYEQQDVRHALQALAVYYARVKESPEEGASYFSSLKQLDALPTYIKKEVTDWASEFASWAKNKKTDSSKRLSEAEALSEAKKLLQSDDLSFLVGKDKGIYIKRLRASARLQQVLEGPSKKSPQKAQALLLLGQLYPRINQNLFFRFGEMYLKACIREYPKTSTSKSCYLALEQSFVEGFSGSGGLGIPQEEQNDLMDLKKLAF